MWTVQKHFGCPQYFVDIVKVLHDNTSGQVVHKTIISAPFLLTHGLKQGYVLAPTLFGLYLAAMLYGISTDNRGVKDLYFCIFEVDRNEGNVISSVSELLRTYTQPVVHGTTTWGELSKSAQGLEDIQQFLGDVDDFLDFLSNTKIDLEGSSTFITPEELWTGVLSEPQEVKESSTKPDIIKKVEEVVLGWALQIEQVMAICNQLRREKETIGPMAELVYWRRLLARYTSIVEHLRSIQCKNFILALTLAQSRVLRKWKVLDNEITDACNEAEDNVKYLYALEKYCEPLYRCDPHAMGKFIPSLMYVIRMVYATSRYYNTTERVTALLVKVSNQMINACRAYLTENGTKTVWMQAKSAVINKIEVCLNLYKKYALSFEKTKKEMELTPGESAFDCSEMYVFGKFETFKIRLEKAKSNPTAGPISHITPKEVTNAIRSMKNQKAPGPDDLLVAFWKLQELKEPVINWLTNFFSAIVDSGCVPNDWATSITITDVLSTSLLYSILESSKIEGIHDYAVKFNNVFLRIATRKYESLEHRKPDFDDDYLEFKRLISDTEMELYEFMNQCLTATPNIYEYLRLLARFEKLGLPCLHIDDKYIEAFEAFYDELEAVRDYYNEYRHSPYLAHNVPPVSGRIMWVRQMHRRIEEPMNILKVKENVIKSEQAIKPIRLYNTLVTVFVHYEQLYHSGWYTYVPQVRQALALPLLLKHPRTFRYVINFDPFIMELIRETEYMWQLGLPTPDMAQIVTYTKKKFFESYESMKDLVRCNDELRRSSTKSHKGVYINENPRYAEPCPPQLENNFGQDPCTKPPRQSPQPATRPPPYTPPPHPLTQSYTTPITTITSTIATTPAHTSLNTPITTSVMAHSSPIMMYPLSPTLPSPTQPLIEEEEEAHNMTMTTETGRPTSPPPAPESNRTTPPPPAPEPNTSCVIRGVNPAIPPELIIQEIRRTGLQPRKATRIHNAAGPTYMVQLLLQPPEKAHRLIQHGIQLFGKHHRVEPSRSPQPHTRPNPSLSSAENTMFQRPQQPLVLSGPGNHQAKPVKYKQTQLYSRWYTIHQLTDGNWTFGFWGVQVTDLKDARIEKALNSISCTLLIHLPREEPMTPNDFLDTNIKFTKSAAIDLEIKSRAAEKAAMELISKFLAKFTFAPSAKPPSDWMDLEKTATSPSVTNLANITDDSVFRDVEMPEGPPQFDVPTVHSDCMELFLMFSQNTLEALVRATKLSLELLKKRSSGNIMTARYKTDEVTEVPLFCTNLTLQIPNIVIQPTIDEIQTSFAKTVTSVLDIHKGVIQWGQRPLVPKQEKKTKFLEDTLHDEEEKEDEEDADLESRNYYSQVIEHKEIVRSVMTLQGTITSLRPYLLELTQSYLSNAYLWDEAREEKVKEFVDREPITQEVREEFEKYVETAERIQNLPDYHVIGPIQINMENFKLALLVESNAWKYLLGRYLTVAYRNKLNETVNFITDKSNLMQRKIKDLDDVRLQMKCLNEIRERFIDLDQTMGVMEEMYAIFAKYEVDVPKEDVDQVDTLQYNFQNMVNSAKKVQANLCEIQAPFQLELIEGVESFRKDVEQFDIDFELNGPMVPGIPAEEASERVLLFQARFDDLWHRYEMYSSGEALFGMAVNEYPTLMQRKKELNLLGKLYGLYDTVMKSVDGYFDILWTEIDIEAINTEILDFKLRCQKLPKGMKDWPAFIDLKKKIDDFCETIPLLEMMTNKAMKDRHWKRLSKLCNYNFDIESEGFTLRSVMEAPLLKYKDDVEDICISAVKEKDIEAKLKQVIADWSLVELQFSSFKARGELLLKGTETAEVIALLEDSLMVLGSLLTNRYNAPFKKDIQQWVQNLSNSSDILENWLTVQNLWIYLEAVFVGGDIAKQLPAEAKRFNSIDKSWVKIMTRAHEMKNVITCCVGDETMGQLLPHLLEQLESCQKSLTGYLESKRLIFPRFFFVSDPALLEILGQASDSHTIQNHLLSVFDNVAKAHFHERDYDRIIAVASREDETISLEKDVLCVGGVENWLGTLLNVQQASLAGIIALAAAYIIDPEFDVLQMLEKYPAQVGLLGIQLLWTSEAEVALNHAKSDRTIMKATNQNFLDLLNLLIAQTVKDLTHFDRTKYETLVTIHLHQRDIFDDLCRLKVKNVTDFEWLKQARFYFDEDKDECLVRITDVTFIYQNEFLGCTERLVITPLTDRCYITLAQSIGMSMGGAPAGPAGTGKTETTKDMGRALGKYVVVFNCSDQMDFRGLGRIFKGLAQSGSWGCFDEFNRIELPVLSVAAQQIAIVLTAKKERKTSFIFSDGDTVSLNPEFGIFLTMNPGYAGRQELPENLKINFRTVAMMVPDRQIIIRVKLASCGFIDNINLSRKFFTLYKLCEEQLSKQVHYDFGLRNILSVLRTLGAQKRANPNDTEETCVMRVLRDMNLSKLVDEDEPLFISLIEDLFPGIKLSTSTYKELQRAIENATKEMGLINHPSWNLKVIQFYETSLVRHGLMALGPTGSGKTTMIHTLMKAMTECGRPHRELRMNPKAITAPQMFGRLDVATNDWTDGIFSTLWRKTLKIKKNENIWLVLDGPVDAVWIENLNSVLDDNKTLTLANGDRITMAPNCKLLFEPDNVDNASPATVSRMGMVFISASSLTWPPILEGWFLKRTQQEADVLRTLFEKIYSELHTFVQVRLKAKMPILESLYIRQVTDILQGLLDFGEEVRILPDRHLEKLFLFTLMWSLGAVLELDDRERMEEFVLSHESKLDWPKLSEGENIFEYVVSPQGAWQNWSELVEEYIYPTDSVPEYSSILVPNVDNVRTAFLVDNIAKQAKSVLLIGEQGTAKTVMIKGYMSRYDPEFHLNKSFNFSSATTPNMVQRIIESYVDKRVGTTYGPPAGRKMTIFIDDINMPIINEWGDQVTNEIVRQLMEMGGFYSLDKPGEFSTLVDLQFIAAMNHPGGGRNDIPPRLKRQFNIFNCTLPSNKSMDKIFGVISSGYFCIERFKQEIVDFVPKLVPLTRRLWQQTKVKMLPTPAKFHYVFNLRDLSRIWQGILYVQDPELPEIQTVLKLWAHECRRVISDRFVNAADRKWFDENMKKCAETNLEDDYKYYYADEVYFVDFLREPPEATGEEDEDISLEPPKIYEEIPSYEFVSEKLFQYMASYNETVRGATMDMVFFHDAMVHLMIISRIVRTPRGNALLVGVGGSGKQSLTKLASHIAGYKIYQITLTRSYNVNNFMDDLKHLYRVSGFEGHGISFIFTDNDIKDEAFLEFLNNVLSAGEVANLFAKDEIDEITGDLVPVMKKVQPKRPPTGDNLYDFFISRARANLHIVLCFSPVGEKFRSRSLKFPGLISGCTMDWFSRWPRDALIAVSYHFLSSFKIVCTPETKVQIIELMGAVQDSVAETCVVYYEKFRRQTHVTPKSFLSFLDGYKKIYRERFDGINVMAKKMSMGLSKLVEAAESVDILRKELEEKEKEIQVASAKAETVLAEVTAAATEAEKVKSEVQVRKDKAQALFEVIAVDKALADEKLQSALPALEAAEAALKTIKNSDIATVRKLAKPPYLVTLIMDCVVILFQKKISAVTLDMDRNFLVPTWSESLKVMADMRFLYNLQNFPKDRINAEMVELLLPYFDNPLYTFENAKQACGNVAGLLQWTISMSAFYAVNKEVLPLKAKVAIQQAKLEGAKRDLQEAEAALEDKERELREVQANFDQAMAEKQAVLDDAAACQRKMDAATALINGLAGEKKRWTEQSAQFKSEIERLVGDVLLLTGFLSYSGPFNQDFRIQLQTHWKEELLTRRIPVSKEVNIIETLCDTATIGEWNLQGLPNDELSIQNGIIVTKAPRFPLLIDPQGQGKIWIRNKEKDNDLQVTSLNHKYFRNHIEDCLSLGRPLLIEDVGEELDPALDNVLEKNYIKIGTTFKVKVGDKEVDVSLDFRLYITTKLPNPAYTPEIAARTSMIDFTVTIKGLEDQLLGRVILFEKKELEFERTSLIQDVTFNKRKMKELEENLLYKLTTVQGSLVDDESVIEVLNVTKDTATQVREKLIIAADTEVKITAAREEFRPVATRGSVLYFLVVEMSKVNCMYQTSLVQFLERFDLSMERSDKTPLPSKRIYNIIEYLTFEIFRYKARGLYEEHKFLFTLLMTLKIDLERRYITYEEFQTFIKGGAALDLNTVQPKPNKWITDMTWLNLVQLSSLRQFQNIVNQVSHNDKPWKIWFDKEAPEEEVIPDGYNNALDVFRRLLMVRSWCPDRTLSQSRKYVGDSLGLRYNDPVVTNLEAMLEESRPLTPMVCFLSMGSDPTPMIEALAKKLGYECRAISMGQGQEVHARKLLSMAMTQGCWILLQNCHLGLAYMNELFLVLFETESCHEDFRVWITTEVHIEFPISLLQISIKFTNEPPQGMRAGLKRTYSSMNQDMLDYTDAIQYLPMIYGVSFLHSVVQERRKFGPLGWNIPYEFNSADWYASCMFVQNHLDDMDPKRGVSWNTVRYMLGEIQYGGRVTDDFDKRLLNTFAKVWFSENMFSDTFQFYTGYKIMRFKNLNDYLSAIDDLPTVDPPQVYGLHPNADITYQSNVTKKTLDQILSIQPKESSGAGGETRETVVGRMATDMLQKLPKDYDPFEVKERLKIMGITSSMNIFLRQELDRMQKVIKIVRTTLKDLLLAIEGTIIMNEALRDALDNIYDARIPALWRRVSWVSSTLGFWFTELLERNMQFSTWIFVGRPPQFWMTGFFNPQGFLTAMRQEVARAHKGWALDSVTLHNEVTKLFQEEVRKPPGEGVYVYGLYLEGAGWDKKNSKLVESPMKVLYVSLPVVHIFAINSTAPKDPKLYLCPVYKKPNRTDLTYVTPLWLPSNKPPEHWILRGVAILCDIK
ncbi:dynein axonemal heavy chain 8 [Anabrus simplex]|uniref:dynein axonemal heavy chain 8 n=1 Tax=Anabrus simplex TaxID=316456 RepID=UPI0035A2BC0F